MISKNSKNYCFGRRIRRLGRECRYWLVLLALIEVQVDFSVL